jgi:hypothetical protein
LDWKGIGVVRSSMDFQAKEIWWRVTGFGIHTGNGNGNVQMVGVAQKK